MNIRRLNLRKVIVQHLGHRRACDIRALLGEARIGQIPAGVLGIGHVHIGDDVYDSPIGFLRQAFVLAAVAGFHVEDGDVQTLGADHAKTRVRIPQHQHGVRLHLHHELVALGNDVAHGLAQVVAYSFHVHVGIGQFQVFEEHAVQVIVVVLAGMCQEAVKVLAALVNHGRQADDLRAGAHNDEELKLSVILECGHITSQC